MDISAWPAERQVEHVRGLKYFELMAFLRKEWMHPGRQASTRALLDGCGVKPDHWLLEVGCGTGASSVFAAATYGCRVMGVDHDPAMIARATARAAAHPATVGRVAFSFARGVCLPFPDASFDLVFSEAAIGFMADKPRVLADFRRVVKPGGLLGVVDFHYTRDPGATLMTEMNRAVEGHLEPLSARDWDALYREAGWEPLESRELSYGAVPVAAIQADASQTLLKHPELNALSEPAKDLVVSRLHAYEGLFNRNRDVLGYRICRLRNPG